MQQLQYLELLQSGNYGKIPSRFSLVQKDKQALPFSNIVALAPTNTPAISVDVVATPIFYLEQIHEQRKGVG